MTVTMIMLTGGTGGFGGDVRRRQLGKKESWLV
jgi:hypothetical protein